MVRSVCHPPFAKSREGWGTHCVVCHRKAGPPAIGVWGTKLSTRLPIRGDLGGIEKWEKCPLKPAGSRFNDRSTSSRFSNTSSLMSVHLRNANIRALVGSLRDVLAVHATNAGGVTKGDREVIAAQGTSAVAAED